METKAKDYKVGEITANFIAAPEAHDAADSMINDYLELANPARDRVGEFIIASITDSMSHTDSVVI